MYFQNDKPAYIKAIQSMLSINPTGKTDQQTLSALKSVASRTDNVSEYAIFLKIKDLKKENEMEKESQRLLISQPDFPYKFGDGDENTSYINLLLKILNRELSLGFHPPRSGYIDRDSIRIVLKLREIFRLKPIDCIDEHLFLRIKREIDLINFKTKIKKLKFQP
jgi:hypothetical protein